MTVRARRTIVTIVLLLPCIVLQGMPSVAPDWLSARLLGVPGTVWLVALEYAAFVVLIWRCMHDDGDEPSS